MKWSGAAPCQCHSPGGVCTTSPGWISATASPRDWTSPIPSTTYSVWPTACACHAVRAPGENRTAFTRIREGSAPLAITSNHTSPVKRSAGPLVVGCFGRISTRDHSHSMVPGGLLVTSRATRLTPGTSPTMRDAMRSTTSPGSRAQSAVMASSLVTARITMGCW